MKYFLILFLFFISNTIPAIAASNESIVSDKGSQETSAPKAAIQKSKEPLSTKSKKFFGKPPGGYSFAVTLLLIVFIVGLILIPIGLLFILIGLFTALILLSLIGLLCFIPILLLLFLTRERKKKKNH